MRGSLRTAVVVAALALGGCGDSGGSGKSATRPAELFGTAPSGFKYEVPDAKTLDQVSALVSKQKSLEKDDVAVRAVVPEGEEEPVALGVVIDSHRVQSPEDAADGARDQLKKRTGKEAETISVAGTEAALGEMQGTRFALAAKNGYVLEAIAADDRTVNPTIGANR